MHRLLAFRPPIGRWIGVAAGVLVLTLGLHPALHPAPTQPNERPDEPGCWTDISYPIELRVVPENTAEPGGIVHARIEVESKLHLERVEISVLPAAPVQILTPAAIEVGRLDAGQSRTEALAVRLPDSPDRRTVEVRVTGWADEFPLTRSAILNLLPGGGEAYRIVTRADGRRIHEVQARRIG
jgi:hypothetical protein